MPRPIKQLALDQFESRLARLKLAAQEVRRQTPELGWVKAIRTALGMTDRAIAKRLGVVRASVQDLERNERSGKVTLESLRRAAEALDADLIYAIVPRRSLRATIAARAREVAKLRVAPVAHSMAMEEQGLTPKQINQRIEELARDLEANPRELWR
jgi:predicted DNA-binding mobile mystery protein A